MMQIYNVTDARSIMPASKYQQLFGFVSILSCIYCMRNTDPLSRAIQHHFVEFSDTSNNILGISDSNCVF